MVTAGSIDHLSRRVRRPHMHASIWTFTGDPDWLAGSYVALPVEVGG
jgi:hypothetical protein